MTFTSYGAVPLKADTVTVANNGDLTKRKRLSVPAFPYTTDLFPRRDGVAVWAGACGDAEPATPPHATLTPGGSVTTVVSGVPVAVTVTRNGSANAAAGVPVTARHASDPASCPSGATLPLGTTTSGGTLQVSLPYGTWQLDAGWTAEAVTLTPGKAAESVALVAR